ncbi:MAG: flagellar motor protein MotB [Sulfurimonas sp.]|uniref:flagellar motor protein MotB n=1 Tax=Sulfurimonas sp. TaxID=2022749 RepID=UPI00261E1771|nr:flagellar motor protein MotB [Sulfurimonas sp.]MDD5401344.1 flagellar motor protein MotB [Sulfurimonas sp.]
MGKKHKCKKVECPPSEKWAVPTADFFSLLLALFIALYAIASTNKEKMKAVKEEFVKIYDFAPVPETMTPVVNMVTESKPTPESTANPAGAVPVQDGGSLLVDSPPSATTAKTVSEVVEKIQKELKSASLNNGPLEQAIDGVLLKLPAFVPFNGASANINNQEIELFIRRIADIINILPPNVDISIRGYTDNQPLPKGSVFKDNIELSYYRADAVMRELIKDGVSPDRLSIAGFGAAKPLVQNDTEENRAKNRRVEFFMFVSSGTPLDKAKQKNILDALNELKK